MKMRRTPTRYPRRTAPRRQSDRGDSLLLVTLAQGALCVLMVTAAFVLGGVMRVNGLREAFAVLLSEETQAVEVMASIEQTAQAALESQPVQKARAAVQQLLGRLAELRRDAPDGGQGGQLPIAPSGAGQAPDGTTLAETVLSAPMASPLTGALTSSFGFREHPITGESDFHTGIDLAAPMGTPIHAVYPGVVAEVGESKTYGNYVLLDHGGVMTRYCHCESILVRVGMRLRQGERVATVGSTGVSTGPHLHLELRVDGKAANPLGEGHWVDTP